MKKLTLFFLCFLVLLQLGCESSKPDQPNPENTNVQELLELAARQSKGISFSQKTMEDAEKREVILRNDQIGKQVFLDAKDTTLVLGYHSSQNKKDGKTEILKYEIAKVDTLLSLIIKDQDNRLVEKNDYNKEGGVFKVPEIDPGNPFPDCDEFLCNLDAMRCEANRTCKTIYYHVHCCDGDVCLSISYIFRPENIFCNISRPIKIDIPLVAWR